MNRGVQNSVRLLWPDRQQVGRQEGGKGLKTIFVCTRHLSISFSRLFRMRLTAIIVTQKSVFDSGFVL